MRRAAMFVGLLVGMLQFTPVAAQQAPAWQQDRPWWFALEIGEGQLQLSSDQSHPAREANFAVGFAGGHSIGTRLRAGAHINGWLQQAFDYNNPTVGEGVSNVGGVLDAFPVRRAPLFVRGGVGLSMYENDRPNGVNGHGLGWEAGGGYEIGLPGFLAFAPMVEYAAGNRGNAYDPISPVTGRRYSVVEFKLGVIFKWGKSRNAAVATPRALMRSAIPAR